MCVLKSEHKINVITLRQASHYTILSLRRRPAMVPHDADVVTTYSSVRPSAMPSVMILYIEGNRRRSLRIGHVQKFHRDCVLPREITIASNKSCSVRWWIAPDFSHMLRYYAITGSFHIVSDLIGRTTKIV